MFREGLKQKNRRSSLIPALLIIGLLLALFGGWLRLAQRFPALKEPKTMTYNWNYQGRQYTLSLTAYKSVFDYYNHKQKGIYVGDEDSSINRYLETPNEDNAYKELTDELNNLAAKSGLDDDQRLELAVAFVQNIPYDTAKAKTDLKHPRYAYEVLYEGKGICSGKSFLMYAILKQMGYGSAILDYPDEKHMNVGVETEMEYSTDNSGYSMIETTNPKLRIGVIPRIDKTSRQARTQEGLRQFNLRNPNTTSGTTLSSPKIYAKTSGKKYNGVVRTYQAEREIADIKNYLTRQQPLIMQKEDEIKTMERRMNTLKTANNIRAYNALVMPHNQLVEEVKSMISEYNSQVTRYNSLVKETFS